MSYETELIEKYGQYVFGKWCAPDDAIYIGRGSIFGNPFPMQNKSHDERLRVCMEYRTYLANKIANNPSFANEVRNYIRKILYVFAQMEHNLLMRVHDSVMGIFFKQQHTI